MVKRLSALMISSADSKALAAFYRDVVGLRVVEEFHEDGEDGYSLDTKSCDMYIGSHSEIHGENKQPQRFMLNFEVDDITKEVERVKAAGAKVVKDTYTMEGFADICTFADPDGNYFQLVQMESKAN